MEPRRIFLSIVICLTAALGLGYLLPRLNPVTQADLPSLSSSLGQIETVPQRQRVLGYKREEFGNGWARVPSSQCTSREMSIIRQLQSAPPGCSVSSGLLHDPYANAMLDLSNPETKLEVDHVFPLSAAWDMGAHAWDSNKRVEFANDPLNLVVTAREHNQEKSDQLPSRWLPPHAGAHCWYGKRLAAVAAKYDLPLTGEDTRTVSAACRFAFLDLSS